jgi:hypothetical protein
MHRNTFLKMNSATFLTYCQQSGFQGSGPGGQHRNKTNTGVHLRLHEFNLEIRSCDDRSTTINRQIAVDKLRLLLALKVRCIPPEEAPIAFPGTNGRINPSNDDYTLFIADVLDRIQEDFGELKRCASVWKLSKTALIRILFANKTVLAAVQEIRIAHGRTALTN